MIFYFHEVLGVSFVIRDDPYGVSSTLTVGPNIRLISILIHCVQHWPVIEPTLAQRLVFTSIEIVTQANPSAPNT